METSREVARSGIGSPPDLGSRESLFLGEELGVDLWINADVSRPQSLLIRATTPEGQVHSAFMHLDGRIEQIPVFNNPDPLVLQNNKKNDRNFVWSQEKQKKSSWLKSIIKGSVTLLALVFLASALTGFLQLRVVLTGSMKPSIQPGDLIIAASTKLAEPHVGDVVLYGARDLDGKMVTVWSHRIIAGDASKGFTIKGDANSQPDIGNIPLSDIQSVVIARLPFIGHLFNLYSMILIFSGLGILTFLTSRRKHHR